MMEKIDQHFRFLIDHESELDIFMPQLTGMSYYQRIVINNAELSIEMGEFAIFERKIEEASAFLTIEKTNRYLLDEAMIGDLFLYENKTKLKKAVISVSLEQAITFTTEFFQKQSIINAPYFPRLFYTFRRKNIYFHSAGLENELFYLDFDLNFYLPLFTQGHASKNPQVFLNDRYGRSLLSLAQAYQVGSLCIAQEKQLRVKQASTALIATECLKTLKYLPVIAKSWMGEYHLKRLLRMPNFNHLSGYEYESKLSLDSLYLQQKDLPYPILERYQTESIRWYRNDQRIGFRGDRASVVSKGKADLIDAVAKRTEEKTQQLSTWDFYEQVEGTKPISMEKHFDQKSLDELQLPEATALSKKPLEMRRMKRQLCVLSPSANFYSICLDYCTADHWQLSPLKQIEIEYNGKFLFTEWIYTAQWWQWDFILGLLDQTLNQIKSIDQLDQLHFEQLQSIALQYEEINDKIKGLLKQIQLLHLITLQELPQATKTHIIQKLSISQSIIVHFKVMEQAMKDERDILIVKAHKTDQELALILELQQRLKSPSFEQAEKEVLSEINLLVEEIKKRTNAKSTKKTKKKWLIEGIEKYLAQENQEKG